MSDMDEKGETADSQQTQVNATQIEFALKMAAIQKLNAPHVPPASFSPRRIFPTTSSSSLPTALNFISRKCPLLAEFR